MEAVGDGHGAVPFYRLGMVNQGGGEGETAAAGGAPLKLSVTRRGGNGVAD
jgi:hypothetical protein